MTKKIEINGITGEIVERDFTTDELELIKADQAEAKAQAETEAKRAKAKADVIAKLGLTADEVAALLS